VSLKTDYLEGLNGYTAQMAAVFAAGVDFVTTNSATITTELQTAASKGKKSFTITLLTTFETANLRLEGTHMDTFFAGIVKAFADEDIYSYEVSPSLDTTDSNDLYVILTFTF